MKRNLKSFEELMSGIENYPDISDEEIELRLQVFFNGWEVAEKLHRKKLNNLSFQLNRKILEGCQGEDLIRFYNERVGAVLDDFIF